MSKYLIDTNVISELARKVPNSSVLNFFESLDVITLSVVTIEEIEFGIERLSVNQRKYLWKWWSALLSLPPIILVVDEKIAKLAGNLRAKQESKGRGRTQADMLIAATAISNGLILVTRNTKDFSECGVSVLNPF
ncbi:MAG: type II toxin-antitoxin system VapC family toxin [Leptospiraceae bacterium]|nr:type II toxin-antitoxin system VapC family toxin [Leptospiraceae bacterium]